MTFRRILREPLLHFLLVGLALFAYYGHVAPGNSDSRRVVVTQPQVDDLARQFTATWNRPPTPTELSSLVESYVHDEILYREGQALGLARDDVVIKRRVRQKLDIMAEEESVREAPTDADLEAYLREHPATFAVPATVSFEQVLVGAGGPGGTLERRVAALKDALAHGADPTKVGAPTMLPAREEGVSYEQASRDFGERFADSLRLLAVGTWSGPVESEFGVHLVRVSARTQAVAPPLAAVRAQVAREWENAQRKRALEASYQKLRQTYQVVIEAKLPTQPKA